MAVVKTLRPKVVFDCWYYSLAMSAMEWKMYDENDSEGLSLSGLSYCNR